MKYQYNKQAKRHHDWIVIALLYSNVGLMILAACLWLEWYTK